MSDPPVVQPLVSNSPSASSSPPKQDLPSLRQRSLEQAQEELTNRTQSPTSTAHNRFDLIKGRRNAVDANASQSTTPSEPSTKPQNAASNPAPPVSRPPAVSNNLPSLPSIQQQQQQQQQQQAPQGNAPPAPNAPPRPKQTIYTFPSPPPDTADLLSELEEFYSYVEVPQVLDHKKDFEAWFDGEKEFVECSREYQISTIRNLLSSLTSPSSDSHSRSSSARHLLHIAHGAFSSATSTSPEHHLHLVLGNCRLLREAGALESVWEAIKRATDEWEVNSGVPSHLGGGPGGQHDEDESEDGGGGGPYHAQQRHQPPPVMLSEEEEEKERARQERLDEINAELATLLAVVYFMVECFRGEDEWGQQLMALDPPMPIHLFNLVAGLREKNAKGYPVKKLLLLLWKSLLCAIGGMRDVERVKTLVREVEGLPKDDPNSRPGYRPWTKSTIPSLLSFRNETLAKYPTFTPVPPSQLLPLPPQLSALSSDQSTLDRISAAAAPIPIKPTFSYHINGNHDPSLPSNQYVPPLPGSGPPPPAHWQPATPAPSPPPSPAPQMSPLPLQQQQQQQLQGGNLNGGAGGGPQPPKPKKQQYQTDQTRPFPLPFAPSNYAKGRSVPRSIEEASELFRRDLRVSSEIWQGWKIREEYRSEEMGWGRAEQVEKDMAKDGGDEKKRVVQPAGQQRGLTKGLGQLRKRMEELAVARGESEEALDDGAVESDDGEAEEEEDPMDPLTVLRNIGRQMKKEEDQLDKDEQRKRKELQERRGDLQRLERVELLYRHTLANLQSAVIVLLKLLLATVTANQNLPNAANANMNGEGTSEPPPDLSLEDCDILRHREITSKAVSAILILTLKWFKASHVMKFHYFSQLLVDSNCLLLILKMFGLQEVSTLVRVKHDRPEHNFFKFCHDSLHPSVSSSPRPEDLLLSRPPVGDRSSSPDGASSSNGGGSTGASAGTANSSDEDVELISDYSWRNFFSTINFVHILQKLTKRKTHRVLLMVQYKSSAILKRILKVSHPSLQLYVLKVIKSQVPYCGRKWRQSNMKVITAIYLHVRPDLRDEWLAGVDVDADVEESLPHEQALRALVRFFNTKHYGKYAPLLHRRSSSSSQDSPELHSQPAGSAPLSPAPLPSSHADANGFPSLSSPQYDPDVFPPSRSVSSIDVDASGSMRLAYGGLEGLNDSDLTGFEVDDLLLSSSSSSSSPSGGLEDSPSSNLNGGGGVGGPDVDMLDWLNDPLGASDAAWEKLGLEGYEGEWDDISDSESTGSWGFMRFGVSEGLNGGTDGGAVGSDGSQRGGGEEGEEKRRNQWEHISPETITALEEERAASHVPNSPRPLRRRSSTGPISPALRPVLFDRDDEPPSTTGRGDVGIGADEEEGPVPFEEHSGPAIDEVELVFHR